MSDFNVFPDAEAVVGSALRAVSIDGIDERVYTSIPKRPTYPLAIVTRVGGPGGERHYLDGARIQIDVWGSAKDTPPEDRTPLGDLHDIAQEARVAVLDLEGTSLSDPVSAFVSGTEDATRIQRLADPVTSRERYFFAVNIYLRATEPLPSDSDSS